MDFGLSAGTSAGSTDDPPGILAPPPPPPPPPSVEVEKDVEPPDDKERLNRAKACVLLSGDLLLVPYERCFVPKYHEWMQDSDILEATGSVALSLPEEFKMQQEWKQDPEKHTFILMLRTCCKCYEENATSSAPADESKQGKESTSEDQPMQKEPKRKDTTLQPSVKKTPRSTFSIPLDVEKMYELQTITSSGEVSTTEKTEEREEHSEREHESHGEQQEGQEPVEYRRSPRCSEAGNVSTCCSHSQDPTKCVYRMVGDVNAFLYSLEDECIPDTDEDALKNDGPYIAELEIMVAEKDVRRQGIGKHAVGLMMRYVKSRLQVPWFMVKINAGNTGSRQLFRSSLSFDRVKDVECFDEVHMYRRLDNLGGGPLDSPCLVLPGVPSSLANAD